MPRYASKVMTASEFECPSCGKQYRTKRGLAGHVCKPKPAFACEFCKARLKTERGLIAHKCAGKHRYLRRHEKPETLAFTIYHHFYEKTMRQQVTEPGFRKSQFYTAFLAFAHFLHDWEVGDPLRYTDFLLRIEWSLDDWCNPNIYARYIHELNKDELPVEAIRRNFLVMRQWSSKSGEDWRDFFRKVSPVLASNWIVKGRLSPWLLFTSWSAMELMERFTPEQQEMVRRAIDMDFWRAKLARHAEDVEVIRGLLEEHNI